MDKRDQKRRCHVSEGFACSWFDRRKVGSCFSLYAYFQGSFPHTCMNPVTTNGGRFWTTSLHSGIHMYHYPLVRCGNRLLSGTVKLSRYYDFQSLFATANGILSH